MYHYAGNNPVLYVDPTGRWTLTITFNSNLGAGVAGSVGVGVAIGFSLKKGFSMGLVETHSVGAQQGASAGAGVAIGLDPRSEEVISGKTKSLTIGASGCIPGASVGGDVSVDIDTGNVSYSGNLSFGIGTPVEAHQLYTETNAINIDDLTELIIDNMTPQGIINSANE